MNYKVIALISNHVPFVDFVFRENNAVLHGGQISLDEWYACLCADPDSDEAHFIITADSENAAWLKLNGLCSGNLYISMLVVAKKYQHIGVGSYAVHFVEEYACQTKKQVILVQTTKDNLTAIAFYQKQGFAIEKEICYVVGDGVVRDGYRFIKKVGGKV